MRISGRPKFITFLRCLRQLACLCLLLLSIFSQGAAATPKTFSSTTSTSTTVQQLKQRQSFDQNVFAVRGVVTAFSGWKNSFFLQDATGSISVNRSEDTKVSAGDEVMVEGVLRPGLFAPLVMSRSVTVLGKGERPSPVRPSYEELSSGRFDSRWIEVRGVVRSAKIDMVWNRFTLLLNLAIPSGFISVHLVDYRDINPTSLVDNSVTIQGVCGTIFNDRKQLIGLRLFVPSPDYLRIDEAALPLAQVPLLNMAEVQRFSLQTSQLHRMKIRGTLTYQSAEHGLFLEENGSGNQVGSSIHVEGAISGVARSSLHAGDRLEVLGFPYSGGYSPGLRDAYVAKLSAGSDIKPLPVRAAEVIKHADGFQTSSYDGRLVQISGTVIEQIPNSRNAVWLLRSGNVFFQAEMTGNAANARFEAQSEVTITGVCLIELDDAGEPASFRLLLRSPDDISIGDSMRWTESFVVLSAGFFFLLVGGCLLWFFERRYASTTSLQRAKMSVAALCSRFRLVSAVLSGATFCVTTITFLLPTLAEADSADSWNVKLGLALGAAAVFFSRFEIGWRRTLSIITGGLLALQGVLALLQYVNGLALAATIRSSHLFSQDGITIAVASCMTFLGFGVILSRKKQFHSPAQLGFLGVMALSVLNIITRLYHASALVGISRHTGMSIPLAIGFQVLALSALFAKPATGFMKTISSANLGGSVSRRLLPAALIIPIFLGWMRLQGQLLGLYDTLFGLAVYALLSIIFFGGMIWASAAVLNHLDFARSQIEEALRRREERLELVFEKSGIGDYTWDMITNEVSAHPAVWALYGSDFLPSAPASWFGSRQHPDDADSIAAGVRATIENQVPLNLEFRVMLPQGGVRWISCCGNLVRNQAGLPCRIDGLNLDITARKESEVALRQSMQAAQEAEQTLHTALQFSKVVVWRWNTIHDQITWAGPVRDVYGSNEAELTNLGEFQRLIYPPDWGPLTDAIQSSLRDGHEYRAQFRIVYKGRIRWIAGRGGVIRDPAGLICGMSGVNFDITSTKDSEQLLRNSEQSFRQLADAMPQIVWTADDKGVFQYFNRKWYDFTGSETIRNLWAAVHPDDLAKAELAWRESVLKSEPFHCEQRIRAANGEYCWHLSRALPVMDVYGKAEQWFGTCTDIAASKHIQSQIESVNQVLEQGIEERSAKIAEIELRYRLLVDGVKDYAIFMLDASGQVKSWNQGAQQLTGFDASEIVGEHFSTFYGSADVEVGKPGESLAEAISNGSHSEEGWRVRKDGKAFWANVVTTPLFDVQQQVNGFSQIIRDMTEQHRTMTLLISERQKAELANEAKSNFLASMSHEIRTPMNAILGMADLLAETHLNEMQLEFVRRFQRAGSHLMTIINDLLDLSKIESGHFELEAVPFDVEEVMQRVMDLVSPKSQQKKINLASRIVDSLRPCFIGDPSRLQQILLNLLGNAVKFTERGEVVLTVRNHPDGDPNHLRFEVSDTGIGIPAEKLSVIFDDFTQAESSTNRRFGGTGLGLGIARRLVQRMGGSLTVTSEIGRGSTFVFDTVFGEGPVSLAVPSPVGQAALDDLSRHRVLIVDTSQTNRMIYREMCSGWNIKTEATDSVRQALQWLEGATRRQQLFSLVLLNRFSSDLEAFEALGQIHSVCPGLPVILTTAEDQPGEVTRAKAAGFAAYVVKPIRRSTLLRLISSALMQPPVAQSTVHLRQVLEKNQVSRQTSVLLVDDSEDNRFLIEAYLLETPFKIDFAENGESALKKFSAQPFDLVLMDMQMPVLDGLQATAAFRALEKKVGRTPVPIIALTGNSMAEDITKTEQVGCNAHLSKPISKVELLKTLAKWQPQGIINN